MYFYEAATKHEGQHTIPTKLTLSHQRYAIRTRSGQLEFTCETCWNLSFYFFSVKSVCFCEAATRHEGQHTKPTKLTLSKMYHI
jgi:hypothetical protein